MLPLTVSTYFHAIFLGEGLSMSPTGSKAKFKNLALAQAFVFFILTTFTGMMGKHDRTDSGRLSYKV